MRTFLAGFFAALLIASGASAQDPAADYPNRPIKIIVCVPAGGGVDTVTRVIAEGLHQKLGQPVVVENRAGASGNIGAEAVFTADPDGYTLLTTSGGIATNVSLYKLAYDPVKDLAPVALLAQMPYLIAAHPALPAKSAQELIALAKSQPGKIAFSSSGAGTSSRPAKPDSRTGRSTTWTSRPSGSASA